MFEREQENYDWKYYSNPCLSKSVKPCGNRGDVVDIGTWYSQAWTMGKQKYPGWFEDRMFLCLDLDITETRIRKKTRFENKEVTLE